MRLRSRPIQPPCRPTRPSLAAPKAEPRRPVVAPPSATAGQACRWLLVRRDRRARRRRPAPARSRGIGQASPLIRIGAHRRHGRQGRLVMGGDRLGDPGDIGPGGRSSQVARARWRRPRSARERLAYPASRSSAWRYAWTVAGKVGCGPRRNARRRSGSRASAGSGTSSGSRARTANRRPATDARRTTARGGGQVVELGGIDRLDGRWERDPSGATASCQPAPSATSVPPLTQLRSSSSMNSGLPSDRSTTAVTTWSGRASPTRALIELAGLERGRGGSRGPMCPPAELLDDRRAGGGDDSRPPRVDHARPGRGTRAGRRRPSGGPRPARRSAAPRRARRWPRATPRSGHPGPGRCGGATGGGQRSEHLGRDHLGAGRTHAAPLQAPRRRARGRRLRARPVDRTERGEQRWLTGSPGRARPRRDPSPQDLRRRPPRPTRESASSRLLPTPGGATISTRSLPSGLATPPQRRLEPRELVRAPEHRRAQRGPSPARARAPGGGRRPARRERARSCP